MNKSTPASLSPFAVFRNRNFSLMWSGQLVSTIGTALTSLAASIYVFRLTDSALSVGLMLMATAAPSLLVGLFAGVFVDRYDRKKIMITADLIRALLVVLIPFLVPINIIWLYIIVMLTSAIGQFFDPAHESVLPEVASDEELASANSLMAISSFGSTAVGFAAAGLIASAADISWAFYIDSATFLISALCIYLINIKPFTAEDETSVSIVISNLRAGMRQLFNTPILRSLFTAQVPVLIAFGLSNTLLLPFALRALKATEFEYGLQEGLTSIGFVVGSLLMANVFDRMREGVWIAVSYLAMAVAGIIYSSLHSIPLAILIVTISGFFNAPSSIARRIVVQRNTPREMRGRVNSVFFVARDVLFLVGMGAAGLADAIDVRLMYLVSALILLLGGILVVVLPGLRQEGAEWRQALTLLRTAPGTSGLGTERPVLLADMDVLVGLVPSLSALTAKERESLLRQARVMEAPAGTTVLHHGEKGDAAYFILTGKVVAGITGAEGNYRSLENMTSGDFFGEIAALTGTARTADVVAVDTTTLIRIPAQALRGLMSNPLLGALFLAKMTERLNRFSINELPRFAGYDQQVMRDLRTAPAEG
ncbi:MAG TPA: MFS transporter [Anaerolineales bacterium]|nr:MFS transporter [Anaerolineales bacterium]